MLGKKTIPLLFIVLLLISSILSTTVSADSIFSDIINKVKGWFEQSPFAGFFSGPVKRNQVVELHIHPKNFILTTESYVNITTNTSKISNFKGDIRIDFLENIVLFVEKDSKLTIKNVIDEINIDNFQTSKISMKNINLEIISGDWETKGNGSAVIHDFSGNAKIDMNGISLYGNASKVIRE